MLPWTLKTTNKKKQKFYSKTTVKKERIKYKIIITEKTKISRLLFLISFSLDFKST